MHGDVPMNFTLEKIKTAFRSITISPLQTKNVLDMFNYPADRYKTTMGWFYAMKVHVIINPQGEIITFYISTENVADNNEVLLF